MLTCSAPEPEMGMTEERGNGVAAGTRSGVVAGKSDGAAVARGDAAVKGNLKIVYANPS